MRAKRRDDVFETSIIEGTIRAEKNGWIIRGINGEICPCKPDVFEKTYEPVD